MLHRPWYGLTPVWQQVCYGHLQSPPALRINQLRSHMPPPSVLLKPVRAHSAYLVLSGLLLPMQDPLALPECMTCVRDGGCNLSCIRFYHSSVPCQQTLTSQLTYNVPLLHEDSPPLVLRSILR